MICRTCRKIPVRPAINRRRGLKKRSYQSRLRDKQRSRDIVQIKSPRGLGADWNNAFFFFARCVVFENRVYWNCRFVFIYVLSSTGRASIVIFANFRGPGMLKIFSEQLDYSEWYHETDINFFEMDEYFFLNPRTNRSNFIWRKKVSWW